MTVTIRAVNKVGQTMLSTTDVAGLITPVMWRTRLPILPDGDVRNLHYFHRFPLQGIFPCDL